VAAHLTSTARGVCVPLHSYTQRAFIRLNQARVPTRASRVSGNPERAYHGNPRAIARTSVSEHTSHMAASATARALAPAQDHFQGEDFASLLDETLGRDSGFDGSVVTGRIVRLTDEYAIVDVGLKSEGRVALKE